MVRGGRGEALVPLRVTRAPGIGVFVPGETTRPRMTAAPAGAAAAGAASRGGCCWLAIVRRIAAATARMATSEAAARADFHVHLPLLVLADDDRRPLLGERLERRRIGERAEGNHALARQRDEHVAA